ncbi:glycoside hydrolase superfamily [Chytridium lagenaria]|nr:glycoside hydrolase superfamily [Chytridium lagenaria]
MHISSILLAVGSAALVNAQQQQWPIFEKDGKQAVLNAIDSFVSSAEASFTDARYPSPSDWANEVVYHILPDRFNDGDPSRNSLNLPNNGQATRWNLAGIIDRIDYLADLGVSALWITPIAKHDGAYHGYCTTDPTSIDAGFGSKEDYRRLVKYAHEKNIKVVMDIVINHLCDPSTSYSSGSSNDQRYDCVNSLNDANWKGFGNPRNQRTLKFSSNFFGPLQSQYFFARCGPNTGDDTSGSGPATVFGDFTDGFFDYDTRNYDFQEIFTNLHKYWIAYADIDGYRLDAAKHVTEDFLAHFSTNIRDYANKLGKNNFYIVGEVAADVNWQGRSLGNMFHDVNNPDNHGVVPAALTNKIKGLKNTYKAHPKAQYPGLSAVYDFFLGGTTRNIILSYNPKADGTSDNYDNSPARIGDYFANQYNVIATQGASMTMSYLPLEIHDWPRLLKNQLDRDPIGTLSFAMAFLMTMQGQPIIYYGAEQGLSGDCNYSKITGGTSQAYNNIAKVCNSAGYDGDSHATSRATMFATSGWRLRSANSKIDALASIGPALPYQKYNWTSDPYLDLNSFTYVNTRRLIRIRRSCAALSRGKAFIRRTDDYGLIAFSRIDSFESVVLMNVKRNGPYTVNSYSINVDAGVAANTVFVNILNPSVKATVRSSGSGKVLDFGPGNLTLDKRGYAIFVPEDRLGGYDAKYQTYLCKN